MRQALNNLQSTHNGFKHVNGDNVYKVCDEPHPLLVKGMLEACVQGNRKAAFATMQKMWRMGYSAEDLISNIFRVCKNLDIDETLKLDFIKVIFLFSTSTNRIDNMLNK